MSTWLSLGALAWYLILIYLVASILSYAIWDRSSVWQNMYDARVSVESGISIGCIVAYRIERIVRQT